MGLLGIAVVGIIVGIVAHLILGEDGYSWFGEILLALVGAILFGLITGIFIGMREVKPEVIIAALIGALLVESIVVVVTFRAVGRGFSGSSS